MTNIAHEANLISAIHGLTETVELPAPARREKLPEAIKRALKLAELDASPTLKERENDRTD